MTDSRSTLARPMRQLGAALLIASGLVHLQQWFSVLRPVPKVGPLFLVNVAAAVVVGLVILARGWRLASLAGIAVAAGTLAGFLLTRYGTLFEYHEPRWRDAAIVAAVTEVAAVVLLAGEILLRMRSSTAAGPPQRLVPAPAVVLPGE